LGAFLFLFYFNFLYFGGIFNKTIIQLALVEYGMILSNLAVRALFSFVGYLPSHHSYPTRARGIIVNYEQPLTMVDS